jgi:hypothetical protein
MAKITLLAETSLIEVLELEHKVWPEGARATLEMFESRKELYPEGFLLARREKELVGCLTSVRINYNPAEPLGSWDESTCGGMGTNHTDLGNTLYIMSLGAIGGVGSELLWQAIHTAEQDATIAQVVATARVPGFAQHRARNPRVTIQEYITLRDHKGRMVDKLLRYFEIFGFQFIWPEACSMAHDAESEGAGVTMVLELRKENTILKVTDTYR